MKPVILNKSVAPQLTRASLKFGLCQNVLLIGSSASSFRCESPLSSANHNPGHSNTDKIQGGHHAHHQEHGQGIRSGRDNRSDDRDHQHRVFGILDEELWRHDSEQRQKENENRQFKHKAQRHDNEKNQIKVIVDLDQWNDRPLKTNKKIQNVRQSQKIRESDAREKKKNG